MVTTKDSNSKVVDYFQCPVCHRIRYVKNAPIHTFCLKCGNIMEWKDFVDEEVARKSSVGLG